MTFKVGDRVIVNTPFWKNEPGKVVKGSPWSNITIEDEDVAVRLDAYEPTGYVSNTDYHRVRVEEVTKDRREENTMNFDFEVSEVLNEVESVLIAKNQAYGNSALNPVRVFSNADPVEQLRVRIDDKLSRLKSQVNGDSEDTVLDLMGYLVLLRIATRKQD